MKDELAGEIPKWTCFADRLWPAVQLFIVCLLRMESELFPVECDQTHDIDNHNCGGDEVAEDRFHPVPYLQSLTGVGLSNEIFPTPAAALAATEDHKDQGAKRQEVSGDHEIPQIQPCRTLCKGLELENAVTQRGGGRGDDDTDCTDDTALRSVPTGQLAHTRKNVLKDCQDGGHGGKYHKQEEDTAPNSAAVHIIKYGSHGIEQQARALTDFQIIRKARGEDDQTGSDGNKRVQNDNID